MWGDEEGPYAGTHYQLAETINVPTNLSRPHPPIVIGGSGEKKTPRLVAQYADATSSSRTSRRSPTSSTSCAATATPWVATTTRSPRP